VFVVVPVTTVIHFCKVMQCMCNMIWGT